MSAVELVLVAVAAQRQGLAVAAWLGETGVAVARAAVPGPARRAGWTPVMQELMMRRAEVMESREELARVGSNLNQLVRRAHIHRAHTGSADTGVPGDQDAGGRDGGVLPAAMVAELEWIVGRVERAVARIDTAVAGIDELTAAAREELRWDTRP